jgi:uncharacterized membrane protein YqjE
MRMVVDKFQDALGRVTENAQSLVRAEVELAKSEMTAKVMSVVKGAIFFIVAGVIAFFGVFGLLITLIWAIHDIFNLAVSLSALIVTLVFFLVAGVIALLGLRKAKKAAPFAPEKAMATVKPLPTELKEAAK